MQTTIHYYRIDTSTPAGQQEYKDLKHRIKANCPEARGRWMKAISTKPYTPARTDSETIEIETNHVFENQWNSTTDRVFDWYEKAIFVNGRKGTTIRRGHWVEITGEMARLRQETHKCGYCWTQYGPYHNDIPDIGFCNNCLDSAYLKSDQLHLLRLLPLVGCQTREPLSEVESDWLTPRYIKRQTTGANSRAKQKRDKQKTNVVLKLERTVHHSKIEHDGMIWLWDHGFDLENVIYYDHTGKFGFGWRSPVDSAVLSKLLDEISEFPYSYEIKTDDGQKLTG